MARPIDSSFGRCDVRVGLGLFGGVKVLVVLGWFKGRKYAQKDIASVTQIDAETYRSGGAAAVGAIIGGALLGPVGLLLGAASGGRRRQEASYLISLADGEYIAVTVTDPNVIRALTVLAHKARVRDLAVTIAPSVEALPAPDPKASLYIVPAVDLPAPDQKPEPKSAPVTLAGIFAALMRGVGVVIMAVPMLFFAVGAVIAVSDSSIIGAALLAALALICGFIIRAILPARNPGRSA